jgi:hypothetical protein
MFSPRKENVLSYKLVIGNARGTPLRIIMRPGLSRPEGAD